MGLLARLGLEHDDRRVWLVLYVNARAPAELTRPAVTMISEVVPAPKIYLWVFRHAPILVYGLTGRFLALFNTVGKTSGFIGPFVTSGIVNHTHGNTNIAFWFLLGMGLAGCLLLYFVDPDQAKIDSARCECGALDETG